MESSNILGAAIRATDSVLQNTLLGDGINFLNETGCSLFFITSSISSMIAGSKNREKALADVKADIAFQEKLQKEKEKYEDEKEKKEAEFKLKIKFLQRQHSREQNCLKLQDEKKLTELEMLFSGWPLASSIGGLLDHIKSSSPFNADLNVVIGRVQSETEKDPLFLYYKDPVGTNKGITDFVIDTLVSLGYTKERLHLMNDKNQLYGGALFANIFAIMHSLPTIVISPVVYDNKIHVNIGCWNQDSTFPYQEEVFAVDYNVQKAKAEVQYLEAKKKELVLMFVAIAAVFNETFLLTEGHDVEPKFATYSNEQEIKKKYPFILDFALKEYNSLLTNIQNELLVERDSALDISPSFANHYLDVLKPKVDSIVELLNQ